MNKNQLIVVVTLFLTAASLSLGCIAVLALPFMCLWNWTVVPLMHAPNVDYWHALRLLLLWFILHLAGSGVGLSAKLRNPK